MKSIVDCYFVFCCVFTFPKKCWLIFLIMLITTIFADKILLCVLKKSWLNLKKDPSDQSDDTKQ